MTKLLNFFMRKSKSHKFKQCLPFMNTKFTSCGKLIVTKVALKRYANTKFLDAKIVGILFFCIQFEIFRNLIRYRFI